MKTPFKNITTVICVVLIIVLSFCSCNFKSSRTLNDATTQAIEKDATITTTTIIFTTSHKNEAENKSFPSITSIPATTIQIPISSNNVNSQS